MKIPSKNLLKKKSNNSSFYIYYCIIFMYLDVLDYFRDATKEEIEFANKSLIPEVPYPELYTDHPWYDETSKVLTYKGIDAIVDNNWGSAHILDYKGEQRQFDLIWDWWYPIDMYLEEVERMNVNE